MQYLFLQCVWLLLWHIVSLPQRLEDKMTPDTRDPGQDAMPICNCEIEERSHTHIPKDPGQEGPSQAERDTETALTRIERGDGEITFRQSKALAASYRAKDAALQAANEALAEARKEITELRNGHGMNTEYVHGLKEELIAEQERSAGLAAVMTEKDEALRTAEHELITLDDLDASDDPEYTFKNPFAIDTGKAQSVVEKALALTPASATEALARLKAEVAREAKAEAFEEARAGIRMVAMSIPVPFGFFASIDRFLELKKSALLGKSSVADSSDKKVGKWICRGCRQEFSACPGTDHGGHDPQAKHDGGDCSGTCPVQCGPIEELS